MTLGTATKRRRGYKLGSQASEAFRELTSSWSLGVNVQALLVARSSKRKPPIGNSQETSADNLLEPLRLHLDKGVAALCGQETVLHHPMTHPAAIFDVERLTFDLFCGFSCTHTELLLQTDFKPVLSGLAGKFIRDATQPFKCTDVHEYMATWPGRQDGAHISTQTRIYLLDIYPYILPVFSTNCRLQE